jgi:hypothetical protein
VAFVRTKEDIMANEILLVNLHIFGVKHVYLDLSKSQELKAQLYKVKLSGPNLQDSEVWDSMSSVRQLL